MGPPSASLSPSEPSENVSPATAGVLQPAPNELELRATEGLARWLPPLLHRWLLRLLSMREVPQTDRFGPITPVAAWFRRDRHRHPNVDAHAYRLHVTGVVRPRSFTLSELRALPQEERLCVMECAGNGNHLMGSAGLVAQGRFCGPSLQSVIDACEGPGESTHFVFRGLDPVPLVRRGYHYGLSLAELSEARALLAVELNGAPLTRPRGFPVRLVVPGIYSMSHVKWLGHIEGQTSPHRGIYNRWVFTNKVQREGRWVRQEARWIGLKSVVTRCVRTGSGWQLQGWAWGGNQPVRRVEVSTDGGQTWQEAPLHGPDEFFPADPVRSTDAAGAWTTFRLQWYPAAPGRYRVASRAIGADGTAQPLAESPQVKGHFNQTRVKWRSIDIPESAPWSTGPRPPLADQ